MFGPLSYVYIYIYIEREIYIYIESVYIYIYTCLFSMEKEERDTLPDILYMG